MVTEVWTALKISQFVHFPCQPQETNKINQFSSTLVLKKKLQELLQPNLFKAPPSIILIDPPTPSSTPHNLHQASTAPPDIAIIQLCGHHWQFTTTAMPFFSYPIRPLKAVNPVQPAEYLPETSTHLGHNLNPPHQPQLTFSAPILAAPRGVGGGPSKGLC